MLKSFTYYQPTEIRFGCGRVSDVGQAAAALGKRALLVTVPVFDVFAPAVAKVSRSLSEAGLAVAHFDGVVPNPTTDSITAGAKIAREHRADVVVGLGGGSSMDSAKAIAVEATHEGSCWDYLFYKTPPTAKTLPVVAVSTTSGTGSQVTQVAVVTNPKTRDKSAIYNAIVYPRVAIVDPELMLTVPRHVTASTGWDAFCHAFEAYLHSAASPYTDALALQAIALVVESLPALVDDLGNRELRAKMAWADTLAGLCIANAGVTLPHGIGMAISGMWPHVMHGESLAATYPAFTRYTYKSAVRQFATVGRIFNPELRRAGDDVAAEKCFGEIDALLKKIGMWTSLEALKIPHAELAALTRQSMVLPDYKNNPRVVTCEELAELLEQSYQCA
jgi:alcohol dehydrogenase class IV